MMMQWCDGDAVVWGPKVCSLASFDYTQMLYARQAMCKVYTFITSAALKGSLHGVQASEGFKKGKIWMTRQCLTCFTPFRVT